MLKERLKHLLKQANVAGAAVKGLQAAPPDVMGTMMKSMLAGGLGGAAGGALLGADPTTGLKAGVLAGAGAGGLRTALAGKLFRGGEKLAATTGNTATKEAILAKLRQGADIVTDPLTVGTAAAPFAAYMATQRQQQQPYMMPRGY